jgi:superfamily II DNA or RNA helicase
MEAMARKDPRRLRALYGMKMNIHYYEEKDGKLIIGRGNLDKLKMFFGKKCLPYEIIDETVAPIMTDTFATDKITLRENQIGLIEDCLAFDNGILNLSTGYGKTLAAMKMIEETKLRTLIVCCKSELSEIAKYQNDIKQFYGYEPGIIQGNKWNIKDITIASISTLTKRNLDSIKDYFGLTIYDECHVNVTDLRMKAIQSFSPKRLYGMTATARRSDGQGDALKFLYGDIIVKRANKMFTPEVHTYASPYEVIGSEFYEMEEYASTNDKRNEMVAILASSYVKKQGKKMIILSKRINHSKEIARILKSVHNLDSVLICSEEKASNRNTTIQTLRDGKEFQILIGTTNLLSTGVDIPQLDCLMFAMSIKTDVLTEQSVGRILRKKEGKETPIIIDIDDKENKIMHRHFNARMQFYRDNKYTIIKKL